jgi:electron-transferring-flavoprotein dehydrogenase
LCYDSNLSADMQREIIETDILCVGAGVATLSTVLRLLKRCEGGKKPSVLILEKGRRVGAHALSGAVLDPEPLADLLNPEEQAALPVKATVRTEAFHYLTPQHSIRVPWVPMPMRSKGYPLISLSEVTAYFGDLCEKHGAEIYCEFPVVELLEESGRIIGARAGDKGLDRKGQPKTNFEPGPDIHAKVVVLGEGACGAVTQKLIETRKLAAHANPQAYALGIKELYEVPSRPENAGRILHTFGYPLDSHTYGGGFMYAMDATHVAVGLIVALDYREAGLDPHERFRRFKLHPMIKPFLADGHVVGYGAKVLPEGGFYSLPELVTDGAIIVGDAAGFVNSVRLKGLHIAMDSGIAAGDALYEAWIKGDFSKQALQPYPQNLRQRSGWKQLWQKRNVRASFDYGTIPGMLATGLSVFSGGLLPLGRLHRRPDHESLQPLRHAPDRSLETSPDDANLQLDVLSDLYYSGTQHEEDQPCHLVISDREKCRQCIRLYGAPCTRFCPAEVYKLHEGSEQISIEPANCLHCKTCQIKDPFENIEWRLPEGGGGPGYVEM